MKGDSIKSLAIAIIVIGAFLGIMYGALNQTISAEYLSDMIKYPSLYTADKAEYGFNWAGALYIWVGSFVIYLFAYIGGAIVENLEHMQRQMAKLINSESQEERKEQPEAAEHIN